MGIIDWYNGKIKNLDVWDIAAIKTYALLFGLVIGAYTSDFVKQYLLIIIVLIALLLIKILYKVFKK